MIMYEKAEAQIFTEEAIKAENEQMLQKFMAALTQLPSGAQPSAKSVNVSQDAIALNEVQNSTPAPEEQEDEDPTKITIRTF